MRHCTWLLALVLAAAMTTSAVAQNANRSKQKSVAEIDRENANANSLRFLKDSLPLWAPMPVRLYMLNQKSQEERKGAGRKQ